MFSAFISDVTVSDFIENISLSFTFSAGVCNTEDILSVLYQWTDITDLPPGFEQNCQRSCKAIMYLIHIKVICKMGTISLNDLVLNRYYRPKSEQSTFKMSTRPLFTEPVSCLLR